MSFKRLDPEDFLISAESVSGVMWSTGNPTLSSFFTSPSQLGTNQGYYYGDVYATNPATDDNAEVQFSVAYGNINGDGEPNFDPNVDGYSATSVVYGQWQNLVLGDENTKFKFGDEEQDDFYVITFDRKRFKEKLLPGFTLTLGGAGGTYSGNLTDNSKVASTVSFNEAGRVFPIYPGSGGTPTSTTTSYGLFLPDVGAIILSSGLAQPTTNNSHNQNFIELIDRMTAFTINFEETISSDFVFVRARNAEYNYSENPSFISGSTGAVIYDDFINNPQTFVTSIGLYNDMNDLLAVAKLSTPLKKDFTKEALVRVKLDF